MSVTIYRRHAEECKHADDRISKQCDCPLWLTGTLFGKPYRKTAQMRSWKAAEKIKRKLEDGETKPRKLFKDSCALFIADCQSRQLSSTSILKFNLIIRTLQEFVGDKYLDDIDAELLIKYRSTWEDAASLSKRNLSGSDRCFAGSRMPI